MPKKTKAVFIVLSLLLMLVAVNLIADEWSCSGSCNGNCTLLNCSVEVEEEGCCAYCEHTYLGKIYCCAPDEFCWYLD